MKLLFVGEGDVHLGCLEMEGDEVTIKKYKPEFDPKIVDAPEEDDMDDMEEHEETETPEEEAVEEEALNVKKPMKFKGGKGLF